MLRIKLDSDLHISINLKKGFYYEPDLSNIDVYILAGDTDTRLNGFDYCKKLLDKYENVNIIYINGNHEYYCSDRMEKVERLLREKSAEIERFHFLENDSILINNIRFIGCTLWTNYNKMNPIDIYAIQYGINDYKYISTEKLNYRNIIAYFINRIHEESKNYIFKTLDESKEDCIVITHHQPYLTRNNSTLKYAYEVDLEKELNECKNIPRYWFSGHTHQSRHEIREYEHGIVNFISNCKGYYDEEYTRFNPNLVIKV